MFVILLICIVIYMQYQTQQNQQTIIDNQKTLFFEIEDIKEIFDLQTITIDELQARIELVAEPHKQKGE